MRFARLIVAAAALLFAAAAAAQDYPCKPVRLIVPQPPGGGFDLVARVVADKLSQRLGQNVVVENRPGSGTLVGTELAAKSPADGYTLLMGALSNIALNPGLVQVAALRSAARLRAHRARGHVLVHADRPQGPAVRFAAGRDRLRAGQSRQAHLRLGRQRLRPARRRGGDLEPRRRAAHARALQGRAGGVPGPARGARRSLSRHHARPPSRTSTAAR